MKKEDEPLVQVEIQYRGGRKNLDAVLGYVCQRLPARSTVLSGDITDRRTEKGFLTYVVEGVESAAATKKVILRSRDESRGGRLIGRVELTKLGGRGVPKPAELTEAEREIVKRYGFALPENPTGYF